MAKRNNMTEEQQVKFIELIKRGAACEATMSAFAKKMNTSPSTLSRYLTGKSTCIPSDRILQNLIIASEGEVTINEINNLFKPSKKIRWY